jgi:4-hydroxy-tetrahydrodipicolinate reductase
MIKVAISGAGGRMGRRLVDLIAHETDMRIVAALERPGYPHLGTDAGELAGCRKLGVAVAVDWVDPADVLIDFAAPEAAAVHVETAAKRGVAALVGTTGLNDMQRQKLQECSKKVPVLVAANMSFGVNLIFRLAAEIASSLGEEYDIEIVEAHHRYKKDAPSGTALRLAEEIAAATGRHLGEDAVYGRHGITGERSSKEIGIHSVRAGDIVGEHTVIYSTLGERIELIHRAHTRDTFVRGAIRAARFLARQEPGMYSMRDVVAEAGR